MVDTGGGELRNETCLASGGSEEVGGAIAQFSEEEGEAEDVAEGLGEGVEGVGESAD